MSSMDHHHAHWQVVHWQPVQVLYCEICRFPPEYCELGVSPTKCKEWLHAAHPRLYEKYYSEEALRSKLGRLSLRARAKLEQDAAKKEASATAMVDAALKKKTASQVTIKRVERNKHVDWNKRKFVTVIYGLEVFDVDLKKAAKFLARKFAAGASATKHTRRLVVQGDVADKVLGLIENMTGVFKGIPANNVKIVKIRRRKRPSNRKSMTRSAR